MDLLLYFALAALATIVIFTGLAWLTRPVRKVDKQPKTMWNQDAMDKAAIRQRKAFFRMLQREAELGINEDTRPITLSTEGMPAHEDSFTHDELWEAAAKMHRETPDEKATIDRWEREMHENAGRE